MKKFLLSCLALVVLTAWAQDVPEKEPIKGEASSAMSAIRLANDLIKYGYSQQLALPLINALQIMNDTQTQTLDDKKSGESETKQGIVSFDFEKIIADARDFADEDSNLLSMIANIEKERNTSHRGAVGGPKRSVEVVRANSTDVFDLNFVAGQLAEVGISGDGDTDLDLFIYDSNGNLIASDTDYTDDCYCRWNPRWTGRFIIKVVNRGGVPNRYVIATN